MRAVELHNLCRVVHRRRAELQEVAGLVFEFLARPPTLVYGKCELTLVHDDDVEGVALLPDARVMAFGSDGKVDVVADQLKVRAVARPL